MFASHRIIPKGVPFPTSKIAANTGFPGIQPQQPLALGGRHYSRRAKFGIEQAMSFELLCLCGALEPPCVRTVQIEAGRVDDEPCRGSADGDDSTAVPSATRSLPQIDKGQQTLRTV